MQKQKLASAQHKIITLDSAYRRVLDAVEQVYAAFAHYRAPHKFDASPLKDADAIGAKVLGRPLRDLSADDLGGYAGSAVTTIGTDLDYRHFLPRILELSIQPSAHQGLELAVIGGRLAYCDWRIWPAEEVTAVEAMFVSGFDFTLTGAPAWRNASDALAGIAPGWHRHRTGAAPLAGGGNESRVVPTRRFRPTSVQTTCPRRPRQWPLLERRPCRDRDRSQPLVARSRDRGGAHDDGGRWRMGGRRRAGKPRCSR